ncbi:C-type natriuretic peptide 2-like [Pholidichthys leucotaenia]
MAASSSSSLAPPLLLLLLFLLSVAVETRPLPEHDRQVLQSLFGSRLSTLILAPPTSDDITEGSTTGPSAAAKYHVVAPFFRDFLQRQTKTRRRSPKWTAVGGRGCFGVKMDRIGAISGLGC